MLRFAEKKSTPKAYSPPGEVRSPQIRPQRATQTPAPPSITHKPWPRRFSPPRPMLPGLLTHSGLLLTLGLLLLCLPLFFWQLDAYTLLNNTEAKQAEVARQMLVRHDWITPWFNGKPYFDKPVLLHWLMALGYRLVGQNEWAVRLPSAIAATLLVLGSAHVIGRYSSLRLGLLSATILAANPMTFGLARTGQHDMLLTLWFSVAMFSWYHGYVTGQGWAYLGFFVCLGLGFLAKGPIVLLSVGAIALFWVWQQRIWRAPFWMQLNGRSGHPIPWGWGLLLFLAITLPWYGQVAQSNGWEFVGQFFGTNNLSRLTSDNQDQTGPLWYYLVCGLGSVFPWVSLWLPALGLGLGARLQGLATRSSAAGRSPVEALGRFHAGSFNQPATRSATRSTTQSATQSATQVTAPITALITTPSTAPSTAPIAHSHFQTYMACWAIGVMGPLSLAATKLPWYISPALPAIAFFCAQAWDRQLQHPGRGLRAIAYSLAALLTLASVGLWLTPQIGLGQVGLVQAWAAAGLMHHLAMVFGVGAGLAFVGAVGLQPVGLWLGSFCTFVGLALVLVNPGMPILDQVELGGSDLRAIALVLRDVAQPGDRFATLSMNAPSLNFYSHVDQFQRYKTQQDVQHAQMLLSTEATNHPLWLITTKKKLEAAELNLPASQRWTSVGKYILFRVTNISN